MHENLFSEFYRVIMLITSNYDHEVFIITNARVLKLKWILSQAKTNLFATTGLACICTVIITQICEFLPRLIQNIPNHHYQYPNVSQMQLMLAWSVDDNVTIVPSRQDKLNLCKPLLLYQLENTSTAIIALKKKMDDVELDCVSEILRSQLRASSVIRARRSVTSIWLYRNFVVLL